MQRRSQAAAESREPLEQSLKDLGITRAGSCCREPAASEIPVLRAYFR